MRRRIRRPRLDIGQDPDYRFSLANERTFLAWIRTALALVAGGLAATQLLPELYISFGREAIGIGLVGVGSLLSLAAFRRWVTNEEAMRRSEPIPASRLPSFLAVSVVLVSIVALILLLTDEFLA